MNKLAYELGRKFAQEKLAMDPLVLVPLSGIGASIGAGIASGVASDNHDKTLKGWGTGISTLGGVILGNSASLAAIDTIEDLIKSKRNARKLPFKGVPLKVAVPIVIGSMITGGALAGKGFHNWVNKDDGENVNGLNVPK